MSNFDTTGSHTLLVRKRGSFHCLFLLIEGEFRTGGLLEFFSTALNLIRCDFIQDVAFDSSHIRQERRKKNRLTVS